MYNIYNICLLFETASCDVETVVETGSHKYKGAVENLDKVVLSGLKH
jgi:hypothetical protein